ncbi:MAG: hypothetical protein M9894_35425 [Planctomycetes bacterium]|nr:hypothetical protein [Planctomycetota bacterium]
MTIRIAPRGGPATCPYCHDGLDPAAVACAGCGVGYHDECAATFGRCAILGCRVPLAVPGPEATPLPRLVAMASRLAALSATDLGGLGDDDDESFVVALLPGTPEHPDASAAVGELLGQTPYDGRLRLTSPVPEPLVRVRGRAAADAVVQRLAGRRARAVALPRHALLRPLGRTDAREVAPGEPPRLVVDGSGWDVPLPPAAERLVVAVQLVEVSPQTETKNLWSEARGRKAKVKTRRTLERRVEPGALVFGRAPGDPVLLRRDVARLSGCREPTTFGRWARVLAEVSRGATVERLEGGAASLLLTRRRPLVDQVEENLPGLLLAARVLHLAWLAA